MKNKLFLFLSLISILTMLVGIAANPLESRSIHLAEVRFVQGKGVVFLFDTTGKFTKNDLKTAYAYAGGNSLDVYCAIKKEKNQIACTVKTINQYAGQSVVIGLLGQGFWATVPEKPTKKCLGFSYLYNGIGPYYGAYPSQSFLDTHFGGISLDEFIQIYIIGGAPSGVTFLDFCVTDASLFGTLPPP